MTKLSSQAQAVLDATFDHWPGGHNHPHKRTCLAAALRAAADQVGEWESAEELRAIATELENRQ